MKLEKIPFEETQSFSGLFLDYLKQKDGLKGHYDLFPQAENFGRQIEKKKGFSPDSRQLIYDELCSQYESYTISNPVRQNLEALKSPKTFTITTGHQLNLASGPLYFIYKIITVIQACQRLEKEYSGYRFVPVYWMASEDHDLEEINHFYLFGKKVEWNTDQRGAVGRMKTDGISDLFEPINETTPLMKKAYQQKTLADATRYFVNEWFGEDGLLVVDGDSEALKRELQSVMRADILDQKIADLTKNADSSLKKQGYKPQILVRDINFFYLEDQSRDRLEKVKDQFQRVDSGIAYDAEKMAELIQDHPERFSPNVAVRPIYQELILPNLAYVGGPAEISYWLQLKPAFEHFEVPFPILLPRNFGLIVDRGEAEKLKRVRIDVSELFLPWHKLKNRLVDRYTTNKLEVDKERKILEQVFESLKNKAMAVDSTLEGYVKARETRLIKEIDRIAGKIRKHEEERHSIHLGQMEKIRDHLFPDGTLQERRDNIFSYLLNHPDFFKQVKQNFDPFDFRMHVMIYED